MTPFIFSPFFSAAKFFEGFLGLLFPPACASCRRPLEISGRGHFLCSKCEDDLALVQSPRCPRCAVPFPTSRGHDHICGKCQASPPFFDKTLSVFIYGGTAKRLIARAKFKADGYAMKAITSLCMPHVQGFAEKSVVVPIPLHVARIRARGFNQAEIAARLLFGADIINNDILHRTRDTRPQMSLSHSRRADNVREAFQVNMAAMAKIRNRYFLIVDDIMTTGATVNAAARRLKEAGAEKVAVFAISRAVKELKL